ncbi:MAG: type II toxin-antitoxin system HicB family antitoxin [Verrucomicrobia bacterium]|nr:type II toxin-antitoxin system HicB family antitoxin [Verrucomicrobiota bacterium]
MALTSKANRAPAVSHPDKDKAYEELRKEPQKRLNLDVPLDLHRKLKARASEQGVSIRDMLLPLLKELVE